MTRLFLRSLIWGCVVAPLAAWATAGDDPRLCLGWNLAGQTWTVGAAVENDLAVADLDGDGRKELLLPISNGDGTGGVEVLRARAERQYAPPEDFTTNARALAVAAADFDGDGRVDLAFLSLAGEVVVMFADGLGGYTRTASTLLGPPVSRLAVGDLDGDGRPDAVATHGGAVTVVYGLSPAGAEGQTTVALGNEASAIALEDFDRDGRLDLAVVADHDFAILLNAGNRSFRDPIVRPGGAIGAESIAAGDLNGDGFPDLALPFSAFGVPSTVNVFYGDGSGGFSEGPRLAPGGDWVPVYGTFNKAAIADLNADGRADLILSDSSLGTIVLVWQRANGELEEGPSYPAGNGLQQMAVADLDGDGVPDVAILEPPYLAWPNTVSILPGTAVGLAAPPQFQAPSGIRSIAAADFDGDGRLDLALGGSSMGELAFLLGDGEGGLAYVEAPGDPLLTGSLLMATADFNRDGRPDLVVATENSSSQLSLFRSSGPLTFEPPENHSVSSHPSAIAAADLDRDGFVDLLVVEQSRLSVLFGDGRGGLEAPIRISVDFVARGGAVADLDEDGVADLLIPSFEGLVWLLRGRGDGTFLAPTAVYDMHPDPPVPPYFDSTRSPSAIVVADFDGDGHLDFALSDENVGWVDVALGSGDGTFRTGSRSDIGAPSLHVAAIDWDRDGVLDLALAREDHDFVTILIGNGDGSFHELGSLAAGSQPRFVAVCDIDGDGRPELAVADPGRNIGSQNEHWNPRVSILANHCGDRAPIAPVGDSGRRPRSVQPRS